MRLLEYQGRKLLEKEGVSIPTGAVAETPDQAYEIASNQRQTGSVVKAQVPVGGRGKAGGIKFTESPEEAREVSKKLLGGEIKNQEVSKLLLVEQVNVQKEFYLSVLLDRQRKSPVIIFSPEGGVDIEEVATESPEKIYDIFPDPLIGLQPYMTREMLFQARVPTNLFQSFYNLVDKLYKTFQSYEATLVEINPLALTEGGELVALDSKIRIDQDSKALSKVKSLLEEESPTKTELEHQADQMGLEYVELEGDIGVIGNGAGLVMSTLDVLSRFGGNPANFLDVGGGADAKLMEKAYRIVTKKAGIKGVFLNIFAGITRCDEIAKGLTNALAGTTVDVPLTVRLTGTREKEGREILKEHGISTVDSIESGAEDIVSKARKGS